MQQLVGKRVRGAFGLPSVTSKRGGSAKPGMVTELGMIKIRLTASNSAQEQPVRT